METSFSVRIILILTSVLALLCQIISLLGHGWFGFSYIIKIQNVTVTQTITQGLFYSSPYIICIDVGNGTMCKSIDEFPPVQRQMMEVATKALNENLDIPKALVIIGLIALMTSILLLHKYICMTKKCTSQKCIGITCAILFVTSAMADMTCAGILIVGTVNTEKQLKNLSDIYSMQQIQFEGHLSFPWTVLVLGFGAFWELVTGFIVAMTTCGKQYNKTVIIYKELRDKESLLDGDDDDI